MLFSPTFSTSVAVAVGALVFGPDIDPATEGVEGILCNNVMLYVIAVAMALTIQLRAGGMWSYTVCSSIATTTCAMLCLIAFAERSVISKLFRLLAQTLSNVAPNT